MDEIYVCRSVRGSNVVTCAGFKSARGWFEFTMRPADAHLNAKRIIAFLRSMYKSTHQTRAPLDAWLALKNPPEQIPWGQ